MSNDRQSTVTISEGINYGLGLLGYATGLAIFGGGLIVLGVTVIRVRVGITGFGVIGALLILFGIVVFYTGFLGLGYKVIADAVTTGFRRAVDPPDSVSDGEY